MTIGKTRGVLYTLARLLGDVNAVKKGKVGKRIVRRADDLGGRCKMQYILDSELFV